MKQHDTIIRETNHILHGGDYNPDQWIDRPDVIDEDFRLMKLAGCNTFSVGIFSWTSYEPEEGVYDFSWLDRIMDRMAAEGHRVMLATPSGAKPAWLSEKYPEIRRVTPDGTREPHKTRHNHCWTSPVYRERVRALNTALAERYQNHPALAVWHISNEYNGPCYCNLCQTEFQKWLKEKYETIGNLNKRWWTSFWNHTFTGWNQIDPRDDSLDALQTDWSRFHTDQIIDFYHTECEPMKRLCPDIPCTTNFMRVDEPLNYWELAKELDLIANDSYPGLDRNKTDVWKDVAELSLNHDFLRTAAKRTGKPWLLMESTPSTVQWKPSKLKAPGMHQAEMLNAIAHGAEGILYFQWRKGAGGYEKFHGAVVDHEGSERPRVFQNVADLGKMLGKMDAVLGSEIKAETALIYDWESRWQLRDSCGTPSHALIGGNDAAYNPLSHYRELWRRSIPTDVISPEHDFSAYKLIVAPQLFIVTPALAEKIRKYIRQGGAFIGTYYLGYVDDCGVCLPGGWPGNGLRDVFGIWNEEHDLVPPGEEKRILFKDGTEGSASLICEILHTEGAEVLAEYAEDFYAGNPVITHNRFGNGHAFYVATEPDGGSLRQLYDQVLHTAEIKTPFGKEQKPDPVSIRYREHPETREQFIFITNWAPKPAQVELGKINVTPFTDGAARTGNITLKPFESLAGRLA